MHDQNSEHLHKLFIVIDDIERAGKSNSDKLKARISGTTIRYKKLYSDPITMPSYSDLITTSNERSPCFISDNNRRNELVVINPELKGDKPENIEFWNSFYAELENSQTCGMWFEFLATYPLELNVRSELCRFDLETLNAHKIKSMKTVHRWVTQFFTDPRCFEDACKNKTQETQWFSELAFRNINGGPACIITKSRAYLYFKYWCSTSGVKIPTGERNFVEDLADIAIKIARKSMPQGKGRPYNFLFRKPDVKRAILAFYELDTFDIGEWCFEEMTEFQTLRGQVQSGTWRYHVGTTRFGSQNVNLT